MIILARDLGFASTLSLLPPFFFFFSQMSTSAARMKMDCTICDYEAGSVEDLRRHKKLMHSSFATITINGKYKIEVKRIGGILTCPVCGVADEDSQTFRNHARQLHSNADDYFKKNPTRHASQNRNRTPYRRPGKTNVWCLASMPCSLFMCSFIDIFK